MQAIFRGVQFSYLRMSIWEEIENEVEKLAGLKDCSCGLPELPGEERLIAADIRQDILEQLASQPSFLNKLRRVARASLQNANIFKGVWVERNLRLKKKLPHHGLMVVYGSYRLNGIEALFETMNVDVAGALGHWIINRVNTSGDFPFFELQTNAKFEKLLDKLKAVHRAFDNPSLPLEENTSNLEIRDVTVLSWHCGIAGVLALVLDYLKPSTLRFQIVEVDVFRQVRDRETQAQWTGKHDDSCPYLSQSSPVVFRLYHPPDCEFDFVVLDMPPPAEESACNQRNRWKDEKERRLLDPGRLTAKRWRSVLRKYLERLPGLLTPVGQAALLLPLGIRFVRGYRPENDLLSEIESLLAKVGLEIIRDISIREESPIAQPFVGNSRPERRLIIVRRRPA